MTTFERAWRGIKSDMRAHLLSVFSVGVAFVCLVSTLLVWVNVDRIHARWESVGRLSVYLKTGVQGAQLSELEQALKVTEGIRSVRHVSSDAARRELLHDDPDEVLAKLPEQAFPASFELEVSEAIGLERKQRLTAQLQSLPAVEAVENYDAYSRKLGSALSHGMAAASLLSFVVLLAVISVVSSTMRLSLQRRQMEVEVLRLVGATNDYVRRPFLVEGMTQGAVGAFFAITLVAVLYGILRGSLIEQFSLMFGVQPSFLSWSLCALLVFSGGVLGVFAATLSLRKMLLI
ncbi:MAG TPA: permease-like cell division protein FtsX [Polyangiaceae bacterium]|nr:permease-like cell division protein FtsX [Polyangiaceae bacterium]